MPMKKYSTLSRSLELECGVHLECEFWRTEHPARSVNSVRVELTKNRLLIEFVNHYITRGGFNGL